MSKHAVSAHSCLWTVHLTLWVVSLHSAWAQEMVHGRVNVPGTSTNTTTDGSLPPSLNVDLNLTASDLHLNFVKDPDINPDLPVYTLYTDSNGKLQIQHQNMDNAKTFGVYQDVTNGAAVGVTREVDENGTSYFNLEGVLHSQGKVYDVKNFRPDDGVQERRRRDVSNNVTNEVDVMRREGEQEFELKQHAVVAADVFDYLPKPPFIQKKKEMTSYLNISHPTAMPLGGVPTSRRKRAVTQDVYVDVVALADYAVYVDWYNRSTASTPAAKQQDALEKIRRYYAFVFNGVNLLYKSITTLSYTVHVRLSSVVVATSGGSSQWTEKYKVTAPQWDEVDANSALADLSAWAQTTNLLPSYDHLMLFSGYDLTKAVTGGGISDKITGLAYTSTLCDVNGKASSIVEDLGGFQCVSTAAHELGHSLSAEHDGTENICLSTDRYIMAAGTSTETAANKLHPWLFSSCSVNYFNTFLADRVRFERGRTCLYSSLTTNTNIPDVSSQLPGQLYDVDAQCRQVYGPNSRLCRGPEFGSAADVCTDMYCYDPTTPSTCFMLVAARGTSCGNKKWCDDGECVYNSAAPALADNCVFGDQPGVAFDGKDCATFVRNFTGYCYQEVVRGRCCKSCSDFYKPVQNCEYGDKASGCSSLGCNRGDTSYLNSCCGTCNYGDPIVTTTARPTTTSTARPTSTTTTAPPGGVLPTTTSPGTSANGTCVDDPSSFINQQRCSGIVASTPEMCYDAQVQKYCCASCRARYTGVAGCEFGDQNTNYCSSQGSSACGLQLSEGNTFDAYCCGTCNYIPSVTTTTTSSTSTTTTTTTPTPTTTTTTPPTTTTTTPRPTTTPTTTTTTTTMPKPTTSITTPTTTTTTPTTTTTTTTTPRPTTTTTTTATTTTTTPKPTSTTTPPTTTTTTTTTPRPTTTIPTTTTTTTTAPNPSPTTTTSTTTTTTTIKPTTPEIRTTTVPPTCVDVSYNACVNVSRDRSVCYNVTLASLCCASCSRLVNSNNPGCEFGDRKPIQCSSLIPGSSACERALSVCCQTCDDLSSSQPKTAAVTSLLVMFAAAVLSVIVSER